MSIATDRPTTLLGGMSPARFMRQHWQKKPLLIRQALPRIAPPLSRAELFELATREGVESRLITRGGAAPGWTLRRGPLPRRALPPVSRPGWTVLVQGVDQHVPAAHDLLSAFRFVPQARLDDLMVSWASEGGGVGPHFDSYDVFLIQVHGRRRWRVGRMDDARLQEGVPLRIIENFRHEEEWILEPGDMLYLPPAWAHDGDAVGGDCMTCSVGFRVPKRDELSRELLLRVADAVEDAEPPVLYRDASQVATERPGRMPEALQRFATQAVQRVLKDPQVLNRALGEYVSEPKPDVWFDLGAVPLRRDHGVRLDARSCMLWDDRHVFLNGESWRAGGRDAALMRRLADERRLAARDVERCSDEAFELLAQWADDGWLHPEEVGDD
jgi:50S ribosomal protein L16 3-hydroxylase